MTQTSAVLIYFAAEASNHAKYDLVLSKEVRKMYQLDANNFTMIFSHNDLVLLDVNYKCIGLIYCYIKYTYYTCHK